MMLAAFKESPCLIQKTLLLLNSLNEDINFVEVVNEDDETNQDLASEVLISTLSKIAIQYKDELTLLDIRRMIYLYLKKDGIVYCDTFADFKNLDLLRQQKMMELLDDKFLTIKEAKNIIYEFNYGFSYSETLNLINKYASNLDNLLKFLQANDLKDAKEIILCHLSNDNSNEQIMKNKVYEQTGVSTTIARPGLNIELKLYPF